MILYSYYKGLQLHPISFLNFTINQKGKKKKIGWLGVIHNLIVCAYEEEDREKSVAHAKAQLVSKGSLILLYIY